MPGCAKAKTRLLPARSPQEWAGVALARAHAAGSTEFGRDDLLAALDSDARMHTALVRSGSTATRVSASYSLCRPLGAPDWELSEWV